MSSVSSVQYGNSYDTDRAVQDEHERDLDKTRSEEEKSITQAKEEYNERLLTLKKEATDDVRRLKEDQYNSQGKQFSTIERDNLEEKKRITEAFEASLIKEKAGRQESENKLNDRVSKIANDAHAQTSAQVQQVKSEFTHQQDDRLKEANQNSKVLAMELANEKYRNASATGKIVKQSNEQQDRAIGERSRVYDDYIQQNRRTNNQTLSEKDQEISQLKNNTDPNKVSPAAKSKIEQIYQQKFQQDLNEERAVNAKNMEGLKNQSLYAQDDVREGYANKFNEMSKELRQRHAVEKHELVTGYNDLESHADMTQRNLENKAQAQSQRMYQQHTNEMSLQQKRYDEQIKGQQETLTDEKLRVKDDLETQQREQERSWTFKMNDTRRDYEKKLLDQQDVHERELSDAKFDFDKKLQEQTRKSKMSMDERVKAYEAQIRQQEAVFKEKERFLTEHYEEEFDKMKRNNAHLSEKKS
jgi:hypothetical protein